MFLYYVIVSVSVFAVLVLFCNLSFDLRHVLSFFVRCHCYHTLICGPYLCCTVNHTSFFHRANFQVTLSICLLSLLCFPWIWCWRLLEYNTYICRNFPWGGVETQTCDTFSRATRGEFIDYQETYNWGALSMGGLVSKAIQASCIKIVTNAKKHNIDSLNHIDWYIKKAKWAT